MKIISARDGSLLTLIASQADRLSKDKKDFSRLLTKFENPKLTTEAKKIIKNKKHPLRINLEQGRQAHRNRMVTIQIRGWQFEELRRKGLL